MNAKPRFRIVDGKPHPVEGRETGIEAARRRFGQPFAHEPGARWKPRSTPLLTEWMQKKGRA